MSCESGGVAFSHHAPSHKCELHFFPRLGVCVPLQVSLNLTGLLLGKGNSGGMDNLVVFYLATSLKSSITKYHLSVGAKS